MALDYQLLDVAMSLFLSNRRSWLPNSCVAWMVLKHD
jgi:hypothetical protein